MDAVEPATTECRTSAGVCAPATPLDCDDLDPCAADSCAAIIGCGRDPIPFFGSGIPAMPLWGQALLALLLSAATALLIGQRRRLGF